MISAVQGFRYIARNSYLSYAVRANEGLVETKENETRTKKTENVIYAYEL